MMFRRHCEARSAAAVPIELASRGMDLLRFARNDSLRVALAVFFLLVAAAPAWAVRPDEMLEDPVLEARAHKVGEELRCLVCRNQSIEDSEADLAHDLRVLVRQRIAAGDTDRQVVDYIHSRYGDFVLLRPPFQWDTALLWAGPVLLVLIGAGMAWRFYRTQPAPAPPLSDDERRRLADLLDEKAET
jgi:cytochrome c-type biogenesis protein CcmH